MSWMQTISGGRFDLNDPDANPMPLRDAVHALGMLCRYNGHVRRFYSVAEHCCLVHDALARDCPDEPRLHLAGLVHDLHEAMGIGDIIHPMKQATRSMTPEGEAPSATVERLMADMVAERFGLLTDHVLHREVGRGTPLDARLILEGRSRARRVKQYDLRILLDERAALMVPSPAPWVVDEMEPLGVDIQTWSPARASWEYLRRLSDHIDI